LAALLDTMRALRHWCQARRRLLAGWKIPRRIEFSPGELPKSGSGKILKRALRERFWVHQERAVS
jgi:acyl-CoA synthetase (AMP-forming)/AMP-acid ligase II